jgi:hypothetical protein
MHIEFWQKKSLGKQLLEWMVDDIKHDKWGIGCDDVK